MLRNPDSIPASDTLIKDTVLEPFFISRSQTGGYTVFENVIKGENNTAYIKTVSYPSNFGNALNTIAKELLNESGKTYEIKQYIARWKEIKNSLVSIME